MMTGLQSFHQCHQANTIQFRAWILHHNLVSHEKFNIIYIYIYVLIIMNFNFVVRLCFYSFVLFPARARVDGKEFFRQVR